MRALFVVSGPLSLAVAAVQAVTSWHHRLTSRHRDPSPDLSDSFSVQPAATSAARPSTSRAETRREIESSFREVPSGLLGYLVVDSVGEDRIRRAWKAGCWARAVLTGRAATPNASEQLNLRPRIYIVLRSERLSAPAGFSSSHSFFQAVGKNFTEGDTLSHSFPSESEAGVYCQAANVGLS